MPQAMIPISSAGARTWGSFGCSAVDVDAGQVAADDRERDQRRDDGADRHHQRALALGQRLQRLARRLVALLGLGVAALHPLPRASARRPAPCACAAAQPPGATSPAPAKARRSDSAAAAGSSASRIARTTPSRRAPAPTTSPALDGSMPPIAKKGWAVCCAACEIEVQPDSRAPLFRRRLPDRPDADVVDRLLAGGGDLLLEWVERPTIASGPRISLASCTGMSSWPTWTPSASQARARCGVVVDDEEGAVGVAEPAEGERGQLDLAARQRLLAQLHDVDAAVQRGAQQRLGILAAGLRLADEVEARCAQPLASKRSGCLRGCQAHRTIIALRRPAGSRGG